MEKYYSQTTREPRSGRSSNAGMAPPIRELNGASVPTLDLANASPPRLPEVRLQGFSAEIFSSQLRFPDL